MKRLLLVLTLVLFAALVFSVIGAAAAYEKYDIDELEETAKLAVIESIQDEALVEQTRSLEIDGKTVELQYKSTRSVAHRGKSDIYTDEAGNEYLYDEKGRFYSYTNMDFGDLAFEALDAIPDEKAESLARDYVQKYFGDILEGLAFERVTCRNGIAQVEFKKSFGKDGMFRGPTCYVDVRYDGVLGAISCASVRALEGFDESLLDGVTEEVLFDHAVSCAKADLYDVEHEVISVHDFSLAYVDGAYAVCISADVLLTYPDSGSYKYYYTYYYELKK